MEFFFLSETNQRRKRHSWSFGGKVQLRLINLVPVVRKVLDLTQLSKSFEITQG